MKNSRTNIRRFSAALVLFLLSVSFINNIYASAAELSNRSVQLSTSFVSDPVRQTFRFNTTGSSNISSIEFEYCTNSPLLDTPCTPPVGYNVSAFAIDSQSGITGFVPSVATTANKIVITRAMAVQPAVLATFIFSNFNNPPTPNEVVFVRISVYDGPNATGTRVDRGAVVFVVEDRFDIQAYVPPYLTFCTGVTVSLDCSVASGFLVDFGEFSSQSTTAVTTQFSVATNDPTGYNTFINGQTMTSGTNIIPALTTTSPSSVGTSQFGINLRLNTNPSVGANPEAGLEASGTVDSSYNVQNQFIFVDGDRIAGSVIPSGNNRYTVSYIVNIVDGQSPGVYATTMTYTAVASF